jgi:hypothetical protein
MLDIRIEKHTRPKPAINTPAVRKILCSVGLIGVLYIGGMTCAAYGISAFARLLLLVAVLLAYVALMVAAGPKTSRNENAAADPADKYSETRLRRPGASPWTPPAQGAGPH